MADHEGERHVDQRDAGVLGQLGERVGGVELGLVGGQREVIALREHRCAPRTELLRALAPAPRQPAPGQRTPRDHAHAELPARREHVRLDAAHEQRVGRLLADVALMAALPSNPLRLDDLGSWIRR